MNATMQGTGSSADATATAGAPAVASSAVCAVFGPALRMLTGAEDASSCDLPTEIGALTLVGLEVVLYQPFLAAVETINGCVRGQQI